MTDKLEDVRNFYEQVTGYPLPEEPLRLTEKRKRERVNHLVEEVLEWLNAETLEDELDALVDLDYILQGTILEQGLDTIYSEAWQRVQAANMAKQGGATKRSRYDAVKPEGWRPPSFTDLLDDKVYYTKAASNGNLDKGRRALTVRLPETAPRVVNALLTDLDSCVKFWGLLKRKDSRNEHYLLGMPMPEGVEYGHRLKVDMRGAICL